MIRKPNLFIIGAAKCGTTSLHHHLTSHPEIYLSEPKEPGYFVPEIDYYPRDLAWYLSLFENATSQRYVGESSTHYTKLPMFSGVPDRIAAFVDEPPRFIYLMRDPIDRAISHYWHNVRKFQEHRPIEAAFKEKPEYQAISNYPLQLLPYFDRFGLHSVYTLTFEKLVHSPESSVLDILKWLELDVKIPTRSFERLNSRPQEMQRVRGRGSLHRLAQSRFWEVCSPRVPQAIKNVVRQLSYRRVAPEDEATNRAAAAIRPTMQAVAKELEAMLGRTFTEWTNTFGPSQ